jgi:hypothetical protein
MAEHSLDHDIDMTDALNRPLLGSRRLSLKTIVQNASWLRLIQILIVPFLSLPVIKLGKLLLGGAHSGTTDARNSGNLLVPSTPVLDSPHAQFLRTYREMGDGLVQLQKKANAILHLNSLSVFALIFSYGFVCLAVIRMLVPINCSGDNRWFMPLSFMYLEKGELANPWTSSIGYDSFNWHGFIHPLAVAAVSIGKGWYGVNSGIIVLGVITFSLFLILAYSSGASLKFIIPAALTVVSMIISYSGRIETTAAILCMLLYSTDRGVLTFSNPLVQRITWVLSGVLIGTIAAAHPGVLPVVLLVQTCFIIAIYGARDNDAKRLCISLAVIFGMAIVSCSLLLIFVYPLPAIEWIDGIATKGGQRIENPSQYGGGTDFGDFVRFLLLSKDTPLLLLYSWFLIPIALALHQVILRGKSKALGYVTFVAFVLAAVALMWRGLWSPLWRYNFTVFVPSILLIVGSLFKEDQIVKYRTATLYLLYVLATAALLTQFVFVHQSIRSWQNADLYNSRLKEIVHSAIDAGLKVGVNGSILTAIDDVDQLRKVSLIWNDAQADPTKFDLVILSQNQNPSQRPIQLRNFKIVEVKYDLCCSWFFPRPLNNAFAAYRSLSQPAQ